MSDADLRARLIGAMTECARNHVGVFNGSHWVCTCNLAGGRDHDLYVRHVNDCAFDALLQVQVQEPCATCEGSGTRETQNTRITGLSGSCFDCDGTGTRSSGSALVAYLIERGELEATGWGNGRGSYIDGVTPVNGRGQHWERLYRLGNGER